jgi:outer membrane immunogenic protein
MRHRFLGMAGLLAAVAAGPALAADLATKVPVYKAPELVPATWTGFYIGVNGGYGTGDWDGSQSFVQGACCAVGPLDSSTHSVNTNGGLAGGQVGYNWQIGRIVTGIEGDVDWSNIRGNSGLLTPFPQDFPRSGEPFWTFGVRNNWLATIRGRLGYDVGGTLIYGTGGLAIGGFHETHSIADPGNGACNGPCPTASHNETKVGWTVGAGIEQALSNNWSVKAEYLYTGFANVGGTMAWDNPAVGPATDGFKGDFKISTFKAGVNYRF